MVYENILELIGKTPLLKLSHLRETEKFKGNIYAKLERFNPAGSSKDRAALFMIKGALERNEINKNSVIIEPTSGNTGIGLASVCAYFGLKLILTMPENMSIERIKLLEFLGAEVILTPKEKGMKGAIEKAEEIKSSTENAFIPSQFENADNKKAHEETTAPEILADLKGKVDVFIAGIGSGGTISGVGKALKDFNPKIEIIGVEPEDSPMITKGVSGPHKIQGIGANFVPENYDAEVVDEVLLASHQKAMEYMKKLATIEGIFVGISSGAALSIAIEIAKQPKYENKNIVVFLPDGGDRYLSVL